jgi:hypothetical protein
MTGAGVERFLNSEANPLSHLLTSILPPEGLQLPKENRTITTLSTRFEIHIIDGVSGVSDELSIRYPNLAGAFPDSLVIKQCGAEPEGYFVHSGTVGQETLIRETDVALREESIPIVLGLGWLEKRTDGGGRLFHTPGEGREAVMVMPKYAENTTFETAVSKTASGGTERTAIMTTAVDRLLALKRPFQASEALSVGDVYGMMRLVNPTYARALTWGPKTSAEGLRASERFEEEYRLFINEGEMRTFLAMEAIEGGVGDQHGDPRPFDNANILQDMQGRPVTVIRDPARLYQSGEGGLPPGWTNFHLSHDYLQLGLLLARSFVDGRYQDLFRYGVEAYSNIAPSPRSRLVGDARRERFFGLGLAYGALVEIIVRGYHGDVGTGPTIDEYWSAIERLAESRFQEWKEEL